MFDSTRPDPMLDQQLDYEQVDDLIVGTVAMFARINSECDVRLLAHDMGPMGELVRYSPLSDDEVSSLVAHLKTALPRKSVTVDPPTIDTLVTKIGPAAFGRTYIPVTAKDIARYEHDYDRWLTGCADAFPAWHEVANWRAEPPGFRFQAQNVGTRPAKDALITIRAEGTVRVMRWPKGGAKPIRNRKDLDVSRLPLPPDAPVGRWHDPLAEYVKSERNPLAAFRIYCDRRVSFQRASQRRFIGAVANHSNRPMN